jgi:hypothetical protein
MFCITHYLKIVPVNPCFAITANQLSTKKQFPQDLKLLSEDCLFVYDFLKEKKYSAAVGLDPETYFDYLKEEKHWNISMRDTSRYEQDIKKTLITIAEQDPTLIHELVHRAESQLPKVESAPHPRVSSLRAVLDMLDEKEMLPAIVFHFDRSRCEYYVEKLNQQLASGKYDLRMKQLMWTCNTEEVSYKRYHGIYRQAEELLKVIEAEQKWYDSTRDARATSKYINDDEIERISSLNAMQQRVRKDLLINEDDDWFIDSMTNWWEWILSLHIFLKMELSVKKSWVRCYEWAKIRYENIHCTPHSEEESVNDSLGIFVSDFNEITLSKFLRTGEILCWDGELLSQ